MPSGELETDLETIRSALPTLLETVTLYGANGLGAEAQILFKAESEIIDKTIFNYWRNPSDLEFFAKALLQPYARWLVESGAPPTGRELAGGERTCPFCGGKPQVSFLQNKRGRRKWQSGSNSHLASFRKIARTRLSFLNQAPQINHFDLEPKLRTTLSKDPSRSISRTTETLAKPGCVAAKEGRPMNANYRA